MRVSSPPAAGHGLSPSDAVVVARRTRPLYARVMGDAWFELAEPIRDLHATDATMRAHGSVRVELGRHRMARVLARSLRLPQSAAAAGTELTVTALDRGERWLRAIGRRRLDTWQYEGDASELAERYGCLEFRFRLQASEGRLHYIQREAALRFAARRLRLPGCLAPRVEAREDAAGAGRISVGVRVTLPGIGLLIAYDGTIEVGERRA